MTRQATAAAPATTDVLSATLDWYGVLSRSAEIVWTRTAGREAIAAARRRRFEEIVRFARTHSPFYRHAWRGLPQRDLSSPELPVVTKRKLMARFDEWSTDRAVTTRGVNEFLSDKRRIGERFLGRFLVWKSSGTSGESGIFVQDDEALSCYDALLVAQLQNANAAIVCLRSGLTYGGRAALVAATGDHFASIASWQRACRSMPWSHARAFSVMDPLPTLVANLNDYQPGFLASYPTTLAALAAEQVAGRLRIAPAYIWSGGEHLANGVRARVEEAFRATLVNEYGASECLSIACSCAFGALHVNADWVILEPADGDYRPVRPGERSHTVLLTNLANHVQPIIRYDLGDSITMDGIGCRCGSPLPVIRVEGRHDDVLALRTPSGSFVHVSPFALTTVVEDVLACRRFQLVQTAPAQIAVRIETIDPGERRSQWDAARRALRSYLAQQSLGNVRLVLDSRFPVPDAQSGKLREVIANAGVHAV